MLKSGDKLQFTLRVKMPSGIVYEEGDIIELIEPTGQAPFGYQSCLCNWIVKCKAFSPPQPQSIWSCIWLCVDYGYLKKI